MPDPPSSSPESPPLPDPESLSSDDLPDPPEVEPLDVPPDDEPPDEEPPDELDDVPPDEPDDEPPDLVLEEDCAVSVFLTGAGASATVTAGVVDVGSLTIVTAGTTVAVVDPMAVVAGGASSLAAGSGPFEMERPAMALAARPTLNAIATPAVAAAVVRSEERRMTAGYDPDG